ncbi:hypothetical protein IFM89_028764 [Coptis chinensis]|uniref:Uncharacterized protein n=1 Tax=Coptis chinensis TaxID=261450 RepID=A0A835GYK1_9MAGN|nr:hypothetical protein IFM89_028764 [Coptis chinensis]
MAYDYDANKLAYYLSDDGSSELTFHAVYQASKFFKYWLPFCRKFNVEPRAPHVYFSLDNVINGHGPSGRKFTQEHDTVKAKYEEMQELIARVARLGKVPDDIRSEHKGFREWDSKSRVSALMSNAPLVLNVDCDMHSNNSKALRDAACFFLDPKEGHRIGYVQFPQSFGGITENDLYANGVKRIYEIEFFGTNAHNGPMYAGTGSVHRRESLNGRKYDPKVHIKLEDKSVQGSKSWNDLEVKAKDLTSCTFENGKLWGKEMGLMYGCAVEDVFTGLVLHSRGWQSVYCAPERKAYLGLAPVNTNDTLIQHKRWSTGLLEIFVSDYCPWTNGIGKLKLGQLMCYSFYTLWALWCLPMITYGLVLPLAMVNDISLFPKVSDPWFKVFAFLGIASHLFSLGELLWAKGTIKMWWNETRMWMMKGTSSYLFSVMVIILKTLGISEAGFEITSKVIDEEALKRYKCEKMEFAVASPMFIPPTALSLLHLFCLLKTITTVMKVGIEELDHMLLQVAISAYVSLISLPLYEAMFLRKDKGRMPVYVTMYSVGIVIVLLYISSMLL